MEYKILTYPSPLLRKKAREVKKIGEEELYLVRAMIEIMLKNGGVGLAANQIGVDKKVFVASPNMKADEVLIVFNPRILKRQGRSIAEEGCLSLPGVRARIKRALVVELRGMDLEGKPLQIRAEGLLARIIQHEVDHLEGKIILHYLPFRERKRILQGLKS
jgi:peptide deformylase